MSSEWTDAQRAGEGAHFPSPAVLSSPIHEVLLQDVAASVPEALRARVRGASTVSELNDWLGVAAMVRWLNVDRTDRQALARSLTGDPRRAGLAVARALAARLDPPPRCTDMRTADALGLLWQLTLVGCCLAVRALLVTWVTGPWPLFDATSIASTIGSVLDLPLLLDDWPVFATVPLADDPIVGLRLVAMCTSVALWHTTELGLFSTWLEWARCQPSRTRNLPLPVSWRFDTFHAVWCLQAAVLAVCAVARVAGEAHRAFSSSEWNMVALTTGCVLLVCIALLRAAGRATGLAR